MADHGNLAKKRRERGSVKVDSKEIKKIFSSRGEKTEPKKVEPVKTEPVKVAPKVEEVPKQEPVDETEAKVKKYFDVMSHKILSMDPQNFGSKTYRITEVDSYILRMLGDIHVSMSDIDNAFLFGDMIEKEYMSYLLPRIRYIQKFKREPNVDDLMPYHNASLTDTLESIEDEAASLLRPLVSSYVQVSAAAGNITSAHIFGYIVYYSAILVYILRLLNENREVYFSER